MFTFSLKVAVGRAHSKLILFGEHAVVYGRPAIAVPFPLEVKSTIKEKSGIITIDFPHYSGPIDRVPMHMQGLVACIRETLNYLEQPFEGLLIQLDSAIPLGRGLGSSAAIAASLVRGLFSFYGREVSQKELLALVQISEVYAHGNPSGVDMATVSSEVPIWFQMGQETEPIHIGAPLHVVVADSGRISDTHQTVKSVREKSLSEPFKIQQSMERFEKITVLAKRALAKGDPILLGRMLSLNHTELMDLGVSDEGLNLLVYTARKAGALGAKLTGAGKGGCMLALAKSPTHAEEISNKLKQAGAYQTWTFTITK